MNVTKIKTILKNTDFVHTSGTAEELKVATYLQSLAEGMGVEAHLEAFPVKLSQMHGAKLTVNGKEYPCEGYRLSGSGVVEAPLCYLPDTDQASLTKVKGKIVLIDTGVGYFLYQDLLKNGAVGFITYDGNVHYTDRDIDKKELRSYVSEGKTMLGVNINAKDAFQIVKGGEATVRIEIDQTEFDAESHNVVASIAGEKDEWIVMTAHYDTTPLSHGSYDNMTGCLALLCAMDELKLKKLRYGVKFIFCGSEERGLLGSKAYTAQHEGELEKVALNVNVDMIGTVMGRFIACCSAEEALVSYLTYLGMETGWGIKARMGVYSSDSTPFADKGVPALSFARLAGANQATIHNRYDRIGVLSEKQILEDAKFITLFTERMACAVKCPVSRTIPEKVKTELDEYLNRKRKA